MRALDNILRWSSGVLLGITGICLLLMLFQVTADVTMNGVFGRPIPGTAEMVAYYYMIGAVFLPAAIVEYRDSSIKVDLFYNMAGPWTKKAMLFAAGTAQLVFFGVLARQSGIDAIEAFEKNEYVASQIYVYVWPARFFLPMGFGLAACISFLRLLQLAVTPAGKIKAERIRD
jgi:TRAP-type C4-dicarboxylate transport system permease small subunit